MAGPVGGLLLLPALLLTAPGIPLATALGTNKLTAITGKRHRRAARAHAHRGAGRAGAGDGRGVDGRAPGATQTGAGAAGATAAAGTAPVRDPGSGTNVRILPEMRLRSIRSTARTVTTGSG